MPGLVKIGYSMKDPDLRAGELDHSGTPHPYVVEYDVLVEEPREIEQKAHSNLKHIREGKEWFRCSPEEAVVAIQTVVGNNALIQNFKRADREQAEVIKRQRESEERSKREQAETIKRQRENEERAKRERDEVIIQQREEEERAKQFAEEERESHEIMYKLKRQGIYEKYEIKLKSVLPKTRLWIYFMVIFIIFGMIFTTAYKDNIILGVSADSFTIITLIVLLCFLLFSFVDYLLFISSFFSKPPYRYYFKERAKKSDQYQALLQKRDEELAIFDQENSLLIYNPKSNL